MVEARHWHTLDAKLTASQLATDVSTGLTNAEATARLETHGINDVAAEKGRGPLRMLAAQFADFMIVVLLVAAVISGVVGELRDTIAILVIVLLNAVVGAVQEYRAQRAVAALKRMSAPEARVVREQNIRTINARDVVPGDIVLLEAGDVVPADIRLCEVTDLRTDESALTGESLTVEKSDATLEDETLPIGDRRNLAYKDRAYCRTAQKRKRRADAVTAPPGSLWAKPRGRDPGHLRNDLFYRSAAGTTAPADVPDRGKPGGCGSPGSAARGRHDLTRPGRPEAGQTQGPGQASAGR
jgi:hypothetical protein